MNIIIQSVHFKASQELDTYIREKVSKLLDQNNRIIKVEVTLSEGGSGDPENQYCEIALSVPGDNYFAKKNAATYEDAVLHTVEALQKIMRRDKN